MSGRPGGATHHWRNQRLTAIGLIPLGLWFLSALLRQPSLDHGVVATWLGRPLPATLAALFGALLLWHSMQGIQVVIEDYVPGRARAVSLAITRLVHLVAALVLAYAVVRLATGAPG